MTGHADTLAGDLARLDERIRQTEWAQLDHRVVDLQAWRENRKRLAERRAELYLELEAARAQEEADADMGGDAA